MAKENDTRDIKVGQPADITLRQGELAVGGATLEPVDKPLNHDYLRELAFMEEPMIIMVSESTDENAENPVSVGNNGIFQYFFRGQPTMTKRKFVDCLIVKSSRVTTPKVRNGAGEDAFAIKQHNSHKFPFTIIEDKNPLGIEWLKRRMAEQL